MMINIKYLSERLCANKQLTNLVKKMKPIDMISSLVNDLDLHPKEASKIVLDLIKKSEGLSSPSIERGEYPIPIPLRKSDKEKEEHLTRPQGKTDISPRFQVKRYQFPPDTQTEPDEWPFDDSTKAIMSLKNKGSKKGLTSGKKISLRKNPFNTNMNINQSGGDGPGGKGIYSKNNSSGDSPGTGRSWNSKGTKGWNSPPEKTFDVPPVSKKKVKKVGESETLANAGDNDKENPKFVKSPNTGASLSVALLGYGGTTPLKVNKTGYRGYGKK